MGFEAAVGGLGVEEPPGILVAAIPWKCNASQPQAVALALALARALPLAPRMCSCRSW